MDPASSPPDWAACRARWELGHVISCVLALIAFTALLRAAAIDAYAGARRVSVVGERSSGAGLRMLSRTALDRNHRRSTRIRGEKPLLRVV